MIFHAVGDFLTLYFYRYIPRQQVLKLIPEMQGLLTFQSLYLIIWSRHRKFFPGTFWVSGLMSMFGKLYSPEKSILLVPIISDTDSKSRRESHFQVLKGV